MNALLRGLGPRFAGVGGQRLAGHDYAPEFPGVKRAVTEFFPDGYEVRHRSWVYRKPIAAYTEELGAL